MWLLKMVIYLQNMLILEGKTQKVLLPLHETSLDGVHDPNPSPGMSSSTNDFMVTGISGSFRFPRYC